MAESENPYEFSPEVLREVKRLLAEDRLKLERVNNRDRRRQAADDVAHTLEAHLRR